MNARWQALANRFAAYKQRERALIGAAALAVIVFVGYNFWVDPARQRSSLLEKQISQEQTETATTEALIAGLKGRLIDPDAENRQALATVKSELAASDGEMSKYDNLLVNPAQVPQLLQSLLRRHGNLTLLSLQSLAPVPLLPPAEKKDDKTPPPPAGNLYKHGIEIKVAGNYLDLLAYVAELEHAPQKLLWGKMELAAAYPRSELTLTVYTLSLDSRWLVL